MKPAEALQSEINTLETFRARRATLQADREKIVNGPDLSLDLKLGGHIAAIDAVLGLANDQERRLLANVKKWIDVVNQAGTDCLIAQADAKEAVKASILRSVPENVRDSVDVEKSKAYQAEVSGRHFPEMGGHVPTGFGSELLTTISHLQTLLRALRASEDETTRCRALVRKLAA